MPWKKGSNPKRGGEKRVGLADYFKPTKPKRQQCPGKKNRIRELLQGGKKRSLGKKVKIYSRGGEGKKNITLECGQHGPGGKRNGDVKKKKKGRKKCWFSTQPKRTCISQKTKKGGQKGKTITSLIRKTSKGGGGGGGHSSSTKKNTEGKKKRRGVSPQ